MPGISENSIAGLAFGLDCAGEKGAVAAAADRLRAASGWYCRRLGPTAGFGLRITGLDEGIGRKEIHVAVEEIRAGEGDHVEIAAGAARRIRVRRWMR